MKKNDYLLITATAAYSYLFFEQNAGINFLIFNIVLICIFLLRNKELLNQKKWLWSASLAVVSSVCIFFHSSALSIIANCFSLLLLSAFSLKAKTSAIFSFLFSLFSLIASFVYVIVDGIQRSHQKPGEEPAPKKGYKFIAVSSVLILCVLFFTIYKSANPLFAENTKWINLDFISLGWIFFTLGGFFLVYALFYHKTIPVIENWENNLSVSGKDNISDDVKRLETERFSGMILFVFLNLMLLVLNAGDITSIWFNGALPAGITHSDFVHSGVGMIILSIIIATVLIMFLYRKNFSYIKYSPALKMLVLLWVIQNLLMLFSTAWRNQIYIHTFSFTYKRIGVYVWISLAAIGIIIAWLKIMKERSNWFLIRTNFAVWFSVLVISSTVNWDVIITRYNINNKPLSRVDFYYLFSLSDANIPELIEVTKRKDFNTIHADLKYGADYNRSFNGLTYSDLLSDKLNHYIKTYKNDWQSFDLRDVRIIEAL